MLHLPLLVVFVGGVLGEMVIVSSSPANRSLVREGSSMTLSCETSGPWFLCLWTSPRQDKQCAIREGATTSSVCAGDPRVSLEGGPRSCSITVQDVERGDWGAWMCLLQDPQEFQTDRRLLEVEVARQGEVQLGGEEVEDGELALTEGQTVGLRCTVKEAFPRPSFSWMVPGQEQEQARVGREVRQEQEQAGLKVTEEEEYSEEEHFFRASSVLQYRARLEDTNSSLECRVIQEDSQGRTVYEQQAGIRIRVYARVVPSAPSLYDSQTGVILGSTLASILLVTFLLVILVLLCRRKRHKLDPSPSKTLKTDTPVWHTGVDNWTCQQRDDDRIEVSSENASSSSFETNRSLGSLPTLGRLAGPWAQSSPLTLHHPVLSSRSEGCTSRLSLREEPGLGSRPASTLGVSLHPLSLPPNTPTCLGSRASGGSMFHCTHDCFSPHLEQPGDKAMALYLAGKMSPTSL